MTSPFGVPNYRYKITNCIHVKYEKKIIFQTELERNLNETHHLMETRKNLERALQETEGPMRVTSECIYHREGRKGIDLVNDAPENSLMREVDTIKSCQDKMRQTLEQV